MVELLGGLAVEIQHPEGVIDALAVLSEDLGLGRSTVRVQVARDGVAHRPARRLEIVHVEEAVQKQTAGGITDVIGPPEVMALLADDERFKTNALRVQNNEAIVAVIQAELAKRTNEEWLKSFEAEGIPAGPVMYHDEVFADPQILARGMVAEVTHPKAGKQRTLGVPIKMSATPGRVRRAAPTLGQHDDEVKKKTGKGEKPWPEKQRSSPRSR